MEWLRALAAEFAITLSDGAIWLAIGQALLVGGACLLFGVWVARTVGLLDSDAPAGENLGVGLASGLVVLASWWAALGSGGRSSFTPVAIGFAIAIALAVVRRMRTGTVADRETTVSLDIAVEPGAAPPTRRHLIVAVLGGAAFIVAVALLYGSTLVQSPRDGVQPLEFSDEAYYSILGADLARTGTETIYSPSGFAAIDGLPTQTWYHWGETWLEAAVITVFGTAPLGARHFVVLPLMLLAAAALTGTVVRRVTGSESGGAFLLGFLACLFLAPVPFIRGPDFSAWAVGLLFGITLYGLAAVAVLLVLYSLAVLGRRRGTWAMAGFVGSATALLVPAHIVIALLALVGIGSVWTLEIARSLVTARRLPRVAPVWGRTLIATGIAIVVTVTWGVFTGHGVGGSGSSPSVSPFNAFWRESMAIIFLGSGAFLAIAFAWPPARRREPIQAGMYVGTAALIVTGAIVWGARLGDFNMFHVFFGGIALFATPVAAVAIWSIWLRLRAAQRVRVAIAVLVLCSLQIELGIGPGVVRLAGFGPGRYAPIPLAILTAIRDLPSNAKLAYGCRPFEESAFWIPGLISLDAHTGRRVVPMCFQAERLGVINGAQRSGDLQSPLFEWAPQRQLYPDSGAHPSSANVTSFLKDNGIDYIYADALHPNSLVADAILIATSGDAQVLRVP